MFFFIARVLSTLWYWFITQSTPRNFASTTYTTDNLHATQIPASNNLVHVFPRRIFPFIIMSSALYSINGPQSEVFVQVAKLGLRTVTVRFPEVSGTVACGGGSSLTALTVSDVTVSALSLDSGNKQRDEHLKKDMFDVEAHPQMTFASSASSAASGTATTDGGMISKLVAPEDVCTHFENFEVLQREGAPKKRHSSWFAAGKLADKTEELIEEATYKVRGAASIAGKSGQMDLFVVESADPGLYGESDQLRLRIGGKVLRSEFGIGKAFPSAVVLDAVYIQMNLVLDKPTVCVS